MHLILCILCILTLYSVCCDAEIEFFPDLRKPELKWSNNAGINIETGYPNEDYALQRLSEYFKEKLRFSLQQGERKPAFAYRFPDHPLSINSKSSRPFAVDPSDPRYYSKTPVIPDYTMDLTKAYKSDDDEDITNDEDIDEQELETPVKIVPPVTSTIPHQRKLYNGDLVRGDTMSNGVRIVPATISVEREKEAAGLYIIAIVAGISAAGTVGLIVFGIGYYNLQRNAKAAADVEYPAYGVTGPHKDVSPSGDRRLAQSAHMYHYQHQKQQILAMERAANERHGSMSEADSDEENEEGDYTVYECPGLAPTGEMEVKNPLFQDDPTPATSATTNDNSSSTTAPNGSGGAPDLK